MSDDKPVPAPPGAAPSGDDGHGPKGHVAARVDQVSRRAVDSADDEPAPHGGGTPHEVEGSPVRSPKDLEGNGAPGSANEATRKLPP